MAPAGYREALKWTWASPEELVNGYVQLLKLAPGSRDPRGRRARHAVSGIFGTGLRPGQWTGLARVPVHRIRRRHRRRPPAAGRSAGARRRGSGYVRLFFAVQGICPAVIGKVLVYRDNHMTNTFAKTLAPALARQLSF